RGNAHTGRIRLCAGGKRGRQVRDQNGLDVGQDHRVRHYALPSARARFPVRDSTTIAYGTSATTRSTARSVVSDTTWIESRYAPVFTGAEARAAAATFSASSRQAARTPGAPSSDSTPE